MIKRQLVLQTLIGAMMFCFMAGGASGFELQTITETVMVGEVEVDVVRIADNFIVLYDTSSSMGEYYKNTKMTKIEAEKGILRRQNEKLPPLHLNAGLYTFAELGVSRKTLKPYYEMQPYDKAAFARAIAQLPTKAGGPTLLQGALRDLQKILAGLEGHTVVFLVTDGAYTYSTAMKRPKQIARELAAKYDVCFYVISNAQGEKEKIVLRDVASINACSRVIRFEDYIEHPEFFSGALFVLEERIVQKPVTIQKVVGAELKNILFDYDRAELRPEYLASLNTFGKFLQENTGTFVLLSGFTDAIGSQEYNLGLSRRRAESVGAYLADNFNIARDRLVLQWYGKAHPVADNATETGRAENRRVEVIVSSK